MTINATILGRLGRDAELKYLPSGDPLLSFSIATDSGYGDKKKTHWIDCALFGKRAESIQNAGGILKGSAVLVIGELEPDSYQKDGETKHKLKMRIDKLEFASSKGQSDNVTPSDNAPHPPPKRTPPPAPQYQEDDIPFN